MKRKRGFLLVLPRMNHHGHGRGRDRVHVHARGRCRDYRWHLGVQVDVVHAKDRVRHHDKELGFVRYG